MTQLIKPQKPWTDKEIKNFKQDWKILTKSQLIQKYNRGYESLKSAARRFKVKKINEFTNHNKLKILLNNSNESWYWLGFIVADGYLSQKGELKITLSNLDNTHLFKLSQYLKCNLLKDKYSHITCKDAINGIKLIKQFKIKEKKTYYPCDLESIKNLKQFFCFLTGFIDGDGHLAISKQGKPVMIRVQCYKTWIDNFYLFQKFLQKLNIESKVYIDTQNYARFCIYKQKSIIKLYELIQYLNIPYMERKWDQYKGYTINLSEDDKLLLNESVE